MAADATWCMQRWGPLARLSVLVAAAVCSGCSHLLLYATG